jgi:hypothetical protein
MSEVVLNLPDNLAQEAEANGLLKPEFIESLLRAEIRRRRINKLFAAADRLAELDLPTLSESEVEAEIVAARQSRQQRHATDLRRSTPLTHHLTSVSSHKAFHAG